MSKFISLLLLAISMAAIAHSAHAADFSQLGYNQLQIDELTQISEAQVFSDDNVATVDPLSHEKVDQVLVGPTLKASAGSGFDYYRYVTFYNVTERKERISSLPIHREECWDKSEFFGSYSYAYTYTATVTATESLDGLGLSETMTKAQTLTTARNVVAVGDMEADHIPYMLKDDWSGRTFIETYSNHTHRASFVLTKESSSPWWLALFFPVLSHSDYPMSFEVTDADWTFVVERNIIKHCAPSADDGDTVVPPTSREKRAQVTNARNLEHMKNLQ
jgi:hypothetical protein